MRIGHDRSPIYFGDRLWGGAGAGAPESLVGRAFGAKTNDARPVPWVTRFRPAIRDALLLSSTAPGAPLEKPADALARVMSLTASIRDIASNPGQDDSERAEQQATVDAALLEIGRLTGGEIRLGGPAAAVLSGVNNAQVSAVAVVSLGPTAGLIVAGEVTRAAKAARLVVLGAGGATVADDASFVLAGDAGEATFRVRRGELLQGVAGRINEQAATTGARAYVSGDALVIESLAVGGDAAVRLEQVLGGSSTVAGVNPGQVAQFQVVSLAGGASEIISGSVLATAQQGELRYLGAPGAVAAGTAAFRLSGASGAAEISIVEGESLSDVAARINAASDATGVTATVTGDELRLASASRGADAFVQVEVLDREETIEVTPIDPDQLVAFEAASIAPGTQETLSGQVLQSAAHAALTLRVAEGGMVADDAVFEIAGPAGAAEIAITAGESLTDAAARINARTADTGVFAEVSGEDLFLRSLELGSAAAIEVRLMDLHHDTVVSGVNAAQLSDFQVLAFTDGAQHSLSGSVTQAADAAKLTYQGVLGLVGASSTFTLSGNLGSVSISTSSLQSLSALAGVINSHTGTTGARASVSGNTLTLQSTGVGSAAGVAVAVTSGSFAVSGGNGDGTANGIDAAAVINGQAITAAGNDFTYSDGLGDYAFTVVSGYVGALDSVTINSLPGQFEILGGNGDGTANGADAVAEINGRQLAGSGNRFTVDTGQGAFELEFLAGFSGAFAPITVTSSLADFEITGADGNGRAAGADAVAVIDGTQVTGEGNRFTLARAAGVFVIDFVQGFTGEFDPITASAAERRLKFLGGDEGGAARGADAQAVINGRLLTADGSRLLIAADGAEARIELAPRFVGLLDGISISPRVVLSADGAVGFTDAPERLAEAIAPLLEFGSGGRLAVGLAEADEARRVADQAAEALAQLRRSAGDPSAPESDESPASSALRKAEIIAQEFRKLAARDPGALLGIIDLHDLDSRRHTALALLDSARRIAPLRRTLPSYQTL